MLWLARLEHRFHVWRERRARRRGLHPIVAAFPGYGNGEWVRVLGRVLIAPRTRRSPGASTRGSADGAASPRYPSPTPR